MCQEAIVSPTNGALPAHGALGGQDWGRGRSYLIWHHDERIFVFRQKVEETPELESILVGYKAIPIPVGFVVLLRRQGPAELIEVFFDKSTFLHLQAGVRG